MTGTVRLPYESKSQGTGVAETAVQSKSDVTGLLAQLLRMLTQAPGAPARMVRGEIALVIIGAEPRDWTIDLVEGHEIAIEPRLCAEPLVRIGLTRRILRYLIEGTLDVERAFKEHQLAVEGDFRALERLISSFEPAKSLIGVRAAKDL